MSRIFYAKWLHGSKNVTSQIHSSKIVYLTYIYLISTIVFLESQLRDLQKEVSSSETPTSNNFLKRRSNTVTPEERNGDHVTPFKAASYTVPP